MTDDQRQDDRQDDRRDPGQGAYAPGGNPGDPKEHRHGDVVHSHDHAGPHEHGDDYEYDEAHDPEQEDRPRGSGEVF